ncbi:MAG: glycosyltransferase family 4 protein [Chloroflexi bacterium]|nr:MAG: glycosyltransferase family 4 protein [Chloroflexota bacterium]
MWRCAASASRAWSRRRARSSARSRTTRSGRSSSRSCPLRSPPEDPRARAVRRPDRRAAGPYRRRPGDPGRHRAGARGTRSRGVARGRDGVLPAPRARADEHEVDVAHAHAYDAPAFEALIGARCRVVHTLHLPPVDRGVVAAARRSTDARFTTVSRANAEAWQAAGVDVDVVIPNGIDVSAVPFGDGGRFVVAAGRVSPEKGTDLAIEAARAAGMPLLIVGGIYDREFYDRAVAPHVHEAPDWRLGDGVVGAMYVGPRPRSELHRIFGAARATCMPVRWEEPFGIVALESLAAGTPVVASARGGLRELVDDTVGVLVEEEAVLAFTLALHRTASVERAACRRRAEEFTLAAMLDGYEAVLAGEPRGV